MNQILIEGIGGTYDVFGLILTTGSTFPEAEPSEDGVIEVPGRSGSIDVTIGVYGDVVYKDIEQTLVFEGFERDVIVARRRFVNALSGRSVDYRFSWDPDYLMTGTWKFGDAQSSGDSWARLVVKTRTQPYRVKGTMTYFVNAAGGITVNIPAGRMRVRPLIEVSHRTLVSKDDQTWELQPGASTIRDLYLSGPDNVLTINSYPEYGIATWANYEGKTWAEFEGKTWAQVAALDQPLQQSPIWNDYAGKTWADFEGKRWLELMYPAEPGDEYAVFVQFDWKDL